MLAVRNMAREERRVRRRGIRTNTPTRPPLLQPAHLCDIVPATPPSQGDAISCHDNRKSSTVSYSPPLITIESLPTPPVPGVAMATALSQVLLAAKSSRNRHHEEVYEEEEEMEEEEEVPRLISGQINQQLTGVVPHHS